MNLRRLSLTLVAASLLLVTSLAACGGDDSSSSDGKQATDSDASGTTADTGSASTGCDGHEAGKDGVIRTFCDGSATAQVKIGTAASTLSGGTCEESGGYYTLNFGTVVGPDFTGAKPDYLGALFPDGGEAPEAVTVRAGGLGGLLTGVTGNVSEDKESVHLEGTSDDGPVTVDIGC